MSKINRLLTTQFDVTDINMYINGSPTKQLQPKLILTGKELIDKINIIGIKIKQLEDCKTTMETVLNDKLYNLENS